MKCKFDVLWRPYDEGLTKYIKTANKVKKLNRSFKRSFSAGHVPRSILNYIVAFDG